MLITVIYPAVIHETTFEAEHTPSMPCATPITTPQCLISQLAPPGCRAREALRTVCQWHEADGA